ncbi:radical SAM protein [Anaerosporobacter sp.]
MEIKINRINLLITKKCNLRCRMCDYRLNSFFLKEITFSDIIKIIDQGKALGMKELEISGGEPMVRKDIYDIISYATSQGIQVLMMTNGVLIGEKEVKKLIEAGLNGIVISLEGNQDINDQIRGVGNYERAINAIKYFKEYSNQTNIIKVGMTISKYNYKVIHTFTKFLFDKIGINSISYNAFNKDMLLERTYQQRNLEFDMKEENIVELEEELEKIILYSKCHEGEFPPESYIKKIPDYFQKKTMVPKHGCISPMTGCCIDAAGQVFGCWSDGRIMGNVLENSLEEILLSEVYQIFCKDARERRCNGCLSACFMNIHE